MQSYAIAAIAKRVHYNPPLAPPGEPGYTRAMSLSTLALLLLAPALTQARTWTVSANGKGDAKSFYDFAPEQLRPGDVVVVKPGKYDQQLQAANGVEYRALGKVIVEGIAVDNVSGAKIRGFTLDGEGQRDSGMTVNNSQRIEISACRLSGFFEALSLSGSEGVTIREMRLEDNDHSLMVINSKNVVIERSLIGRRPRPAEQDNAGAFGVDISGSDRVTLDHNTLVRNTGTAIAARNATRLALTNNIIAGNGWGIFFQGVKQPRLDRNLFNGNTNGDEMPPEDPEQVPALKSGGVQLFEPAGFADSKKGDWRLRPDARSAKAGTRGSYLGAFPPLPDPNDSR